MSGHQLFQLETCSLEVGFTGGLISVVVPIGRFVEDHTSVDNRGPSRRGPASGALLPWIKTEERPEQVSEIVSVNQMVEPRRRRTRPTKTSRTL